MSATDNEDLIDLKDFDSIKINVAMVNLTANTGVNSEFRVFGNQLEDQAPQSTGIRLMELHANGISLDVPEKSAANGHMLEVHFDITGADLPFTFSLKGRLTSVTPLGDGREKFDLTLTEVDKRYFEALKGIFSKRQQEIEEFFARVRGEAA